MGTARERLRARAGGRQIRAPSGELGRARAMTKDGPIFDDSVGCVRMHITTLNENPNPTLNPNLKLPLAPDPILNLTVTASAGDAGRAASPYSGASFRGAALRDVREGARRQRERQRRHGRGSRPEGTGELGPEHARIC